MFFICQISISALICCELTVKQLNLQFIQTNSNTSLHAKAGWMKFLSRKCWCHLVIVLKSFLKKITLLVFLRPSFGFFMWTIILMLTFAADLCLHSWVAQFTVEVMKSGKQPIQHPPCWLRACDLWPPLLAHYCNNTGALGKWCQWFKLNL